MLKIFVLVVCVYLSFVFLLYLFQDSLIYIPYKDITNTPKDIGLLYQEFQIVTPDNVELNAWFVQNKNKDSCVVLFSHGNGGNISHRLEKIRLLHSIGLSVFIYDYRGYGLSTGKPSEKGTYTDAESVWTFVVNSLKIPSNRVVIYGESLGVSVAAKLAGQKEAGGFIGESGFSSLKSMGSRLYPVFPVKYLLRYEYDTLQHMLDMNMPTLIIHSKDDEIVPFEDAMLIFKTAKSPKEFVELRGGHNDAFIISKDIYLNGIKKFLQSHLQDCKI